MRVLHRTFLLLLIASIPALARGAWTPSLSTNSASGTWVRKVLPDGAGSVYVSGYFFAGSFLPAWVARYDESFNLISSATLAGNAVGSTNLFYGLVRDEAGFIYAGGVCQNTASSFDACLAKYTSNLVLVSSVTVNGPSNGADWIHDLALDGNGNLYATGLMAEASGGTNLWVARFDTASLSLQDSATYDGAAGSTDQGFSLVVGPSGDVYVSGAVINVNALNNDAWVGKFDSSLNLQTSMSFNGPGGAGDAIYRLVFGPDGNLYGAGSVFAANDDIWVGRFTPGLSLLSSKTFSGPGNGHDQALALAVDGRSNVYIGGYVHGTIPFTSGSADAAKDIYLARLSPDFKLVSERVIAGSAGTQDQVSVLFMDGNGSLYAGGLLQNGGPSAWIARFSIVGDILSAPTDSVAKVKVYPSPFQPSRDSVAAIANLPVGAEVTLHTFTGELVARFTADDLGGIAWDGRNASGESVASGVYYGVASGQGGRKTFKVVVQR